MPQPPVTALCTKQASREALADAERLRESLPRRFQDLRETCCLSKYALAQRAGVSRDRVGCIESGGSIPTLFVAARLAHAVNVTVTQLLEPLEREE